MPTLPGQGADASPLQTPGMAGSTPTDAAVVAVRLLGLVEAPSRGLLVAVVTDGRGVYHGGVGDVIAGRYRVVAIDRTSIEIESVRDGQRRILRPAGS